ncbi:MAG: hypothetical protein WBW33_12215 [Bryobacteraceae bacterium]|jgi:hypothetical protein
MPLGSIVSELRLIGTAEVLGVRFQSAILVVRQGDTWLRNDLIRGLENGV